MLSTDKIQEYQKQAMTTCTGECFTSGYLYYGLISEIGEFSGKIAKKIRGDAISDSEIMGELGDIAWFVVVSAKFHGIPIDPGPNLHPRLYLASNKWLVGQMLKMAVNYLPFGKMWVVFETMCFENGFDTKDVLKYNIKKLSSRQKRGKIGGNGDFR